MNDFLITISFKHIHVLIKGQNTDKHFRELSINRHQVIRKCAIEAILQMYKYIVACLKYFACHLLCLDTKHLKINIQQLKATNIMLYISIHYISQFTCQFRGKKTYSKHMKRGGP